MERNSKILVCGCGYIGISTMIYFTKVGYNVVGIDIDQNKINLIKQGEMPQKDLEEWLEFDPKKYLNRVEVTTDFNILNKEKFEAIFVAVPTEKEGEPWFDPLQHIIEKITNSINKDTLIIIESTLTPGVADKYIEPYSNNFAIAPRRDWFTDKDKTIETLPRIVGGNTEENTKKAVQIIKKVCKIIHTCNAKEAQLVKACENTIRHIGAVFAQQLAWAYPNLDTRKILKLASSKWNVPEYFANILGTSGYAIDKETEILTKDGWKKINEFKIGDEALTFNESNEKLEYKKIQEIFRGNYNGKMIDIKSQTVNMLLHPQHRVFLYRKHKKTSNNRTSKYYYLSAERLPKILQIPSSGKVNLTNDYDPFFVVLGWIYSKGSLWHPKSKKSERYEIGQSKLCKELEKDLDNANIKVRKNLVFKSGYKSNKGYKCKADFYKYYLTVDDTKKFLKYLNKNGSFKRNVFSLSSTNQRAILQGILKGNGNYNTFNNRIWQKNCDQLQELAILAGYRANITQDKKNLQSLNIFKTRPHIYLTKDNVSKIDYNGLIWCVKIKDNNNFVARRKGKMFITGNCVPISSKYVKYGAKYINELSILDQVLNTDKISPIRVARQLAEKIKPKSIGILGVSYLGNIKVHVLSGALKFLKAWKDLRLITNLKMDTDIKVHDSLYNEEEIKKLTNKETLNFPEDLDKFEVLIISSDHDEYKKVDKNILIEKTKNCKLILDNCGIWEDINFKCKYSVPGRARWLEKIR